MSASDLLVSQLTDPFRIGMIVFLVLTMLRTEAVTGRWVPLGLGVAFVAALIPLSIGRGVAAPVGTAVAVGIVANLILLALVLALRAAIVRLRR